MDIISVPQISVCPVFWLNDYLRKLNLSQMVVGSGCLTCPDVRSGDSELETFINRFVLVGILLLKDLSLVADIPMLRKNSKGDLS